MERTLSSKLNEQIGNIVMLEGWLHTLRGMGKIAFLILRDKDGLSQIVLEKPEEITKLDNLYTGTVLKIIGKVVESGKSKYGYEIQDATVEVLQAVKFPSPVDISKDELKTELDTLLENRVVTLRHPRQSAIFNIAGIAEKKMREFFYKNEFTQINSPKMIAYPTEGGAEVFEVSYFDKKAYMAQSPQFYKQIMVSVFERVFEIGRAYRAEKSNTSRHMSEIMMLDAEFGFINNFDEVLDLSQEFLKYIVKETWEAGTKPLEFLKATRPILTEKFPRITVADLHVLMLKETGEDHTTELDVTPSEEKFINEYSLKNWQSEAVFITDFPWSDAKFYHHQSETNSDSTDRADLIFRGVEVATVTRREVNYQKLISQIQSKGIDPEHPGLAQYLDAFKFGMPEEGGFGFGMARFIQKLIGLENAKEAELFPSDPKLIGGVRLAAKIYFAKELYTEMINRLKGRNYKFDIIEHEAVVTSEEAANVRKTKLSEGVKAIILRGKKTGRNVMVCLPATLKLDTKPVEEIELDKFEFEKPETIKNKFGLEVGAIPPFGNLLGMTVYFDKRVLDEPKAAFNAGSTTKSIIMLSKDLVELISPVMI